MKARHEFKSEQEWLEYLRIHFAAMAMQGILSNDQLRIALLKDMKITGTNHENYLANEAVKQADALIDELNRG